MNLRKDSIGPVIVAISTFKSFLCKIDNQLQAGTSTCCDTLLLASRYTSVHVVTDQGIGADI